MDIDGYQRWRGPLNDDTLDKRWAHRDYFHGDGREFPRDDLPATLAPIQQPHLSLAFQSRATEHAIVAFSVPIRNDDGRVIAILAGTRELGSVLSAPYAEYKPRIGATPAHEVDRTIAILDSRDGRLLDHPWLQTNIDKAPVVKLHPSLRKKIFTTASDTQDVGKVRDDYSDPVGRLDPQNFSGQWLAAFSPVGNTGWYAMVQERRDQALQPVAAMRGNVLRTWLGALTVSGLLLTLIWGFVLKSLSHPDHHPEQRETDHARLSQRPHPPAEAIGEGPPSA